MCSGVLVMLQGRCSCANSERPRPSPAPKYPLSPIIPVHPRNSPVSPMIPVHTQKQGGGGLKKLSATSGQRSGSKKKAALSPDFSDSPLATRLPRAILAKGHSLARRSFSGGGPLIPIIPAPLATAALRVVPASIVTTTLRAYVGVPTIWSAAAHHRFSRSSDPRAQARMPVPPNPGETQDPPSQNEDGAPGRSIVC